MTRATIKAVQAALHHLCDAYGLPCAYDAEGNYIQGAQNIPPVRDDVSHAGRMHGAAVLDYATIYGGVRFYSYDGDGSTGFGYIHPVLAAVGLPSGMDGRITTRRALDLLEAAELNARRAADEATEDDLESIR